MEVVISHLILWLTLYWLIEHANIFSCPMATRAPSHNLNIFLVVTIFKSTLTLIEWLKLTVIQRLSLHFGLNDLLILIVFWHHHGIELVLFFFNLVVTFLHLDIWLLFSKIIQIKLGDGLGCLANMLIDNVGRQDVIVTGDHSHGLRGCQDILHFELIQGNQFTSHVKLRLLQKLSLDLRLTLICHLLILFRDPLPNMIKNHRMVNPLRTSQKHLQLVLVNSGLNI